MVVAYSPIEFESTKLSQTSRKWNWYRIYANFERFVLHRVPSCFPLDARGMNVYLYCRLFQSCVYTFKWNMQWSHHKQTSPVSGSLRHKHVYTTDVPSSDSTELPSLFIWPPHNWVKILSHCIRCFVRDFACELKGTNAALCSQLASLICYLHKLPFHERAFFKLQFDPIWVRLVRGAFFLSYW